MMPDHDSPLTTHHSLPEDHSLSDDSLKRRIADLTSLLEVSKHLGSIVELGPLLQLVEKAARDVLACERASVFLYDPGPDQLYSKVATGETEIRFSARLGIAGEAVSARRIVNVPDAYADPRFNREIDKKTGYRTRSILSIPLLGHDGAIVGVLQALNKHDGIFDAVDEEEASVLGSLAGVAIQRQMLLEAAAERQRLLRDLSIARDIQNSCLPDRDPALPGYQIAGWNQPADQTGGDCYDYMELPDKRVAMLIADATGHGIGPALIVAECRAIVRALALMTDDLAKIMAEVNLLLGQDLPGGRFVTAFFGVLDAREGAVRYVSAGHGPLLHYDAAKREGRTLPATTLPLGIMPQIDCGEAPPLHLGPGDFLILVTDGFFEWADPDGEQFGTDRIFDLVRSDGDISAAEFIKKLHASVVEFGRGTIQADDLTAIIVKRTVAQASCP